MTSKEADCSIKIENVNNFNVKTEHLIPLQKPNGKLFTTFTIFFFI